MTEQEYDQAHVLWDNIMSDVVEVMTRRLKAETLSQDQLQFVYEKCTEDLYHAGWEALRKVS